MSPQLRKCRGAPSRGDIKGGTRVPLGKPNHSATGRLTTERFLITLSWEIILEGVRPAGDKLGPHPHGQA